MFEAVNKYSISEQVARQIRCQILNDRLLPGSRLPAERELAKQFGTNRNTLREAIRLLEEEGLIRVRQGGGMEVLDYRRSGGIHLLAHYLAEVEDPAKLLAFVQEATALRREAMAIVARLAAKGHNEEDAQRLREAYDQIVAAFAKGKSVARADIEFHRTLGLATRCLVVIWLVNSFASAFEKLVEDETLWVVEEDYIANIRQVLDSVLARDGEAAARAILRHFEAADHALMQRLKSWYQEEA